MRVLVVGGTGTVGAPLVRELATRGHHVVVLARRPDHAPKGCTALTGDLSTGVGVASACHGVQAVVHVANGTGRRAPGVLQRGTEQLLAAASDAGVSHAVVLSICGIEGVPLSYYRTKVAQERVLAAGAVPWTLLRSTQFHELLTWFFDRFGRARLLLVPAGVKLRPVAAETVAAALADAVGAGPAGRVVDVAGPELTTLLEVARLWRAAMNRRASIVGFPLPGALGSALRAGALAPTGGVVAGPTYQDWLMTHRRD